MTKANSKFLDTSDKLNKMGKERGCRNGKDLAKRAARRGVISEQELVQTVALLNLRNDIGHGVAQFVSVNDRAITKLNSMAQKLERTGYQSEPKTLSWYGRTGKRYFFTFKTYKAPAGYFVLFIKDAPALEKALRNSGLFQIRPNPAAGGDPTVFLRYCVENDYEATRALRGWMRNYVTKLEAGFERRPLYRAQSYGTRRDSRSYAPHSHQPQGRRTAYGRYGSY